MQVTRKEVCIMGKTATHTKGQGGLISRYNPEAPLGKNSHYGLAIADSVPFEVSLVDNPAVAPATFNHVFSIVTMSESPTDESAELSVQENTPQADATESCTLSSVACIFSTISDKMQVGGYVLTPFLETYYGSIINPSEIEQACYKFMSSLTHGSTNSTDGIGHQHSTFGGYGYPIEIFYDTEGVYGYKNAWYMKVQVTDASTWAKIKNGSIRGFSVGFKSSADIMGHENYLSAIFDAIPDYSAITPTIPGRSTRGYTKPPELYPKESYQYADPTNFLYPCSTSAQTVCCLHYLAVDNKQALSIYSESEKAYIFRKLCETAELQGIELPSDVKKKVSINESNKVDSKQKLSIYEEDTTMDPKEMAKVMAETMLAEGGLMHTTLNQLTNSFEQKTTSMDTKFTELTQKVDALAEELTQLKAKAETAPVMTELASMETESNKESVITTEALSTAIGEVLNPKIETLSQSFSDALTALTSTLEQLKSVQEGTDLSQQIVNKEHRLSVDDDVWAGSSLDKIV
jgi:hypothetical protein